MTLDCYEFVPRTKASSLVVLLHGVGSNGEDLFGLVAALRRALPNSVFISPDAPDRFDMAAQGYQWFSLQDFSDTTIHNGLAMACPRMLAFLAAQLQRFDLPPKRLAVIGFSQGAMLGLSCACQAANDWAGVVGFSGYLGRDDHAQTPRRTPVHLVHGQQDEVVPVARFHATIAKLQQTQMPLTHMLRPHVGHAIDQQGLQSAIDFLKQRLEP